MRLSRRYAVVVPLLSVMLVTVAFTIARGQPPAPSGAYCYLQADYDHKLTWVALDDLDPRTNETTLGRSRTAKNDAITVQPRSGVLFGVDALIPRLMGYLGTFDTATGAFQRLPAPLGTGYGALGEIHFYDVSGLVFDPVTGWLYASQIETGEGVPDALFRIDPVTGRFVPGAFAGADYVPMHPLPAYPHLWDIDDIAIDPATGQMYGIVNNSNDGDRLVTIDKTTGALADVGAFGLAEVEGLSFDPHGRLWATAGGAPTGDPANALYAVGKTTGQVSQPRPLDNGGNYEALACLSAAPDLTLSLEERGEPLALGELLVYTLRYANLGNAPAYGVSLTQTLPASTRFHAAASSPGWQPVPDAAPNGYVFDLGTVPPGHRGLVNVAVLVQPRGVERSSVLTTTATLAGDGVTGLDLNPHDNHASWKTTR